MIKLTFRFILVVKNRTVRFDLQQATVSPQRTQSARSKQPVAAVPQRIGTGEPELVTKGASEEGIFLHRKFRGWLGFARPTDSAKSMSPPPGCAASCTLD
ncbi:hypothetical protein CEXT_453671 [Caerostris extrusa]|uniref:Uncharacterized protein n=1 Tax=Caerostris extrusa TaxID=172846 RepID=A0AAV4TFT9_CAEEX|nr:hypothetical protein CEXT_453671 [Caerostris extrusa]